MPLVHDQGAREGHTHTDTHTHARLFVSVLSLEHKEKGGHVRFSQTKAVQDIFFFFPPSLSLSLYPSLLRSLSLSLVLSPTLITTVASKITLLSVCPLITLPEAPVSSPIAGRKRALGSFFNINILVWRGSNDIRELTEFSIQLDVLIEKAGFKGKVHVCADGETIQDGKPRSVSFPQPYLNGYS